LDPCTNNQIIETSFFSVLPESKKKLTLPLLLALLLSDPHNIDAIGSWAGNQKSGFRRKIRIEEAKRQKESAGGGAATAAAAVKVAPEEEKKQHLPQQQLPPPPQKKLRSLLAKRDRLTLSVNVTWMN
jgi:hypothetical protein